MHTVGAPWMWLAFVAFVLAMLALDLGVMHRRSHVVHAREALAFSAVWVGLAVAFGASVVLFLGLEKGTEFFAGYLVEKSLSVDNLFVFVALFDALAIPREFQHRVLFWGILTALVLRAAMIVGGAALLARFEWLLYAFGAFLVLTGWKFWRRRGREEPAGTAWVLRLIRRWVPSSDRLRGAAFLAREGGRWVATPLLLGLAAIEVADVAFAVDSIPAVFAVTSDPFIVFTSNVFAILGLRSLYFLLADAVNRLVHLRAGLAVALVFVGAKMLVAPVLEVSVAASLAVICGILAASVAASLLRPGARVPAGPLPPASRRPETP